MKKLPPFNSEARCEKCGSDDINTYYCKGSIWDWECDAERTGQHLHRDCRRCHYGWLEHIVITAVKQEEPESPCPNHEDDKHHFVCACGREKA